VLLGRRSLNLVVGVSFPRCSVAQRRVKPFRIIAELDVARHVFAGVFTRWVHGPVDPLDLQGRVERFRLSIIKTRPYSSYGMTHIKLGGHLDERSAEILRTPDRYGRSPSARGRSYARPCATRQCKLDAHVVGDRVPDTFFSAAIEDRSQVSETLPGRQISDIPTNFRPGASALKSPPTKSGTAAAPSPGCVVIGRHGRG
jgi:hypothetical protein